MVGKNILLWCREPSWCKGISPQPFGDAFTLIPIFCFDPRESDLFPDKQLFERYNRELVSGVELLRQDLITRGSNLLVMAGHYEKVIPSIARVLQVNEVVTFNHPPTQLHVFERLTAFRENSTQEVSFQLNMHSIPFRSESLPTSSFQVSSPAFPPFPRINPGAIPTAA
ncbi:MAG: deoxyribodipyrimidine photo-lyase [Bacteroidota bacterium]